MKSVYFQRVRDGQQHALSRGKVRSSLAREGVLSNSQYKTFCGSLDFVFVKTISRAGIQVHCRRAGVLPALLLVLFGFFHLNLPYALSCLRISQTRAELVWRMLQGTVLRMGNRMALTASSSGDDFSAVPFAQKTYGTGLECSNE